MNSQNAQIGVGWVFSCDGFHEHLLCREQKIIIIFFSLGVCYYRASRALAPPNMKISCNIVDKTKKTYLKNDLFSLDSVSMQIFPFIIPFSSKAIQKLSSLYHLFKCFKITLSLFNSNFKHLFKHLQLIESSEKMCGRCLIEQVIPTSHTSV